MRIQNPILFSVIIPTFNRETTLLRAISSVLNQTLQQWELIIVDDGSTDETENQVRTIMKQDQRIHYLHQENSGAAAARNRTIPNANGEFLAFLDSDDLYYSNHLASRLALFRNDPNLDFIYGPAEVLGEKNVVSVDNSKLIVSLDSYDVKIGGTFTLKTSSMNKLGGFPLVPYGEDSALFNLAEKHGLKIGKSDQCTYCYDRTRFDSTTMKKLRREKS